MQHLPARRTAVVGMGCDCGRGLGRQRAAPCAAPCLCRNPTATGHDPGRTCEVGAAEDVRRRAGLDIDGYARPGRKRPPDFARTPARAPQPTPGRDRPSNTRRNPSSLVRVRQSQLGARSLHGQLRFTTTPATESLPRVVPARANGLSFAVMVTAAQNPVGSCGST